MRFFLKKISYSKPRYCSFRIKNNGIAPTAAVVNIVPRVDTSYNILYCILRVWVIKKLKAIHRKKEQRLYRQDGVACWRNIERCHPPDYLAGTIIFSLNT